MRSSITPSGTSARTIAAAVVCAGVIAGLGAAGCGNRRRENKEPPRDARQARRVIEPSTDRVGPLPPYAIRGDGVGPYKLGEKLSDLLELYRPPAYASNTITVGGAPRSVILAETT